LCCHSNATRAPIANPHNSAKLGGSLYHAAKLHPGPCDNVGMGPRTGRHTHRHRQTHTQTRVTTIHFASSTTHAKCNKWRLNLMEFELYCREGSHRVSAGAAMLFCFHMTGVIISVCSSRLVADVRRHQRDNADVIVERRVAVRYDRQRRSRPRT